MLLCFTILNSQEATSQTTDSLSQGFLQFQLIGGLGVYYIGDWSASSYFRIGADMSLNHFKPIWRQLDVFELIPRHRHTLRTARD